MHHKRYQSIGLGGTFDHFHAGHQQFITFAHTLADELLIGLTVPQLTLSKPYAQTIEEFEARRTSIKQFCGLHHIRCHVVPLNDVYGPTLESKSVQSLCVTEETVSGATKINDMRKKLQLRELPVYISDYFLDDSGKPLHAEFIRAGQVSRAGKVYASVFTKDLTLTDAQRQFFSKAQGELINLDQTPKRDNAPIVAVVGDASLETFIANNWQYELGIYDKRQLRQAVSSAAIDGLDPQQRVESPAGTISQQLVDALQQALPTGAGSQPNSLLNPPHHVEVIGEEDLSAVALILLLPLESKVYYGQPEHGIICMNITESLKNQVFELLK